MSHALPGLVCSMSFYLPSCTFFKFSAGRNRTGKILLLMVIYCVDFKFSFNNFMPLTTLLLAPLLALQHAGPSRLALRLDVIRSQPVADPKKYGVGIV